MKAPAPLTSDLIARAIIAATISLSEDPSGAGLPVRIRSQRSRAAAASAVARLWRRPLGRVAKWVNLRPEQAWAARGESPPGFARAEEEAEALLRACCGLAATKEEPDAEDDEAASDRVVRLKAVSPQIRRWCAAYQRRGVGLETLSDLFDVDQDALAAAVGAAR